MATETKKAISLAGWKKNATHYPTLPSGSVVGIKIPNFSEVISGGDIPQSLIDIALGGSAKNSEVPTKELLEQQGQFTNHLVLKTVVEPKLTPQDVADLPYEDILFLVEIATRQRDLDALGEHLAGLPVAKDWETFRTGDDGNEALADL